MGNECFNCASPAVDRYTLDLSGEEVLEEKPLCDACLSDFRGVEWIEIEPRPERSTQPRNGRS